MSAFKKTFQIIWADLDPNAHMRHTAYNDYAAQVRVSLFDELGTPLQKLVGMGYGPVLFHEDTTFMKEVYMNETIIVTCEALAFREDRKIWKFKHQVFKQNGDLACVIIATGAFMDLKARKVIVPPDFILDMIDRIPKDPEFKVFTK